jgi:N-acetylmuramate 1-kinase
MTSITERILSEFGKIFSLNYTGFEELKTGVSKKMILRIFAGRKTYIGIHNENTKENLAFFSFTETFAKCRLNVPEILFISRDKKLYFLSDLGRNTLYDYIGSQPGRDNLFRFYKKALTDLVKFQLYGKSFADFSFCYETLFFNKTQIKSDFKKFEKYYLRKYRNRKTESTRRHLSAFYSVILDNPLNLFMYRDFQPRNIIKNRNKLSYVDYQSGRYGPPQYDLISFLYSGSIDITQNERKGFIDIYYSSISGYVHIDRKYFYASLKYFALLRIVQLLGSYCFSFYDSGNRFTLSKIPNALKNLKTLKFREEVFNDLKKSILGDYS